MSLSDFSLRSLQPLKFKKVDIDEENEGLDISLYLSNQDGSERRLKKFNGANNPGQSDKSKFGKLKIKSLKLILNNNPGSNYSDSPDHSDIGIIRAVIERKINLNKKSEFVFDFDIRLNMSTSSEETSIQSCSINKGLGKLEISEGQYFEIEGVSGQADNSIVLGKWLMCSLNGFKTTADDSNIYDGCNVYSDSNSDWFGGSVANFV